MKKYLSILAVMALAASAFAQGTILLQNSATTTVKLGANPTDPTAANLALPGFVQLYWAPAGTAYTPYAGDPAAFLAANSAWKFAGVPKTLVAPGRFNGGAIEITGIAAGGPVEAAVVAWQGNFASFDAAVAANSAVGASARVTFASTGNPTTTPPGTAASLVNAGFAGLTVSPATSVIPEPSSLALAGLGAAALLIFRRRK